jgi:UDP-N-acetylmuramoyl-L-alanyl-D-glutamate--2,6-diaminopimelate ligase
MTFLDLLDGVEVLAQSGNAEIRGVEYDSRQVLPATLFVAMRGECTDGNQYIQQAVERGATAIVTDAAPANLPRHLAWARVTHGRRALAAVSANFYSHPERQLALTGITGTNGKSTTAFLAEAIFVAARRKTVLVGTIAYHVVGEVLPAPHTTPEALELSRILADGLKKGASEAVMEASSHALTQERVYGLGFDVAVFTNLTRDHLDYHHTMEEYFAAKRMLFEGCGAEPPRVAVLNVEDGYGRQLAEISRGRGSTVVTYGLAQGDFHAEKLEITPRGTRFDLVTPGGKVPAWSALIGRVNVYNVLGAAAAAWARGCDVDAIARGVAALDYVPGRFQRVDCGQPFTVVVDYAHTDDALRNLTALAREFVAQAGSKGRVISVFGCGGDRDRNKRPLMGEAAGRGSDLVVLTSDNPRSEDPVSIINDALVGLQRTHVKHRVEPDRRAAIAWAIGEAMSGDIVLLAGKGHEQVQITRQGSRPFDDVAAATEVLQQLGFNEPSGKTAEAGSQT